MSDLIQFSGYLFIWQKPIYSDLQELQDLELRLRNGGLGGIPDTESWKTSLENATDVSQGIPCLISVQESVMDKFVQGLLAKGKDVPSKESTGTHCSLAYVSTFLQKALKLAFICIKLSHDYPKIEK